MFEGGGYGVAVTAAPVVPPPWPVQMPPLGIDGRPVRLVQLMPTGRRTPEQKARELERIGRVEAQLAAYKVEIAAGLARDRTDPRACDDDDHLPGVDGFFPDELALILNCSPRRGDGPGRGVARPGRAPAEHVGRPGRW